MKTPSILITGLVMLALLCSIGVTAAQEASTIDTTATIAPETVTTTSTDSQEMSVADDIPPYDGAIGADSPLYGLKIAMEDLDESFTTNQSERLNKQLRFQQLRIAEVRRELDLNRTATAQRALDLYWQKINSTGTTITPLAANTTGLLHAQEQIARHQYVLENLARTHPDNPGLMRAYNNSLELEQKFEQKTQVRFNRTTEKNNTIIKAVRLEISEQARENFGNGSRNQTEIRTRVEERIAVRNTTDKITTDATRPEPSRTEITRQATKEQPSRAVTAASRDDRSSTGNKGNGNGDTTNNGKDTSRNR